MRASGMWTRALNGVGSGYLIVQSNHMPFTGEPGRKSLSLEALKGVPALVIEDAWHMARALRSILEQWKWT